ncbi:pilus assembly protein [Pseudothauera nasutitermitis]|nr:PilC/PilY family type IV pilus protein [Pseudothauera nasutitermitis]
MRAGGTARTLRIALALCAASAAGAFAGPLALSDTPLTVSTSIDPNVMLLIDNSGSMDHMIWHEDFDQAGSYGHWQYRSGNSWVDIDAETTYYPNNLGRDSCSSGYSRFRLGSSSTYKCLRLPQPRGSGSTRYLGNYLRFLLDRFLDGDTDLTQGQIPADYRMNVARDVAKDLVQNTPGMRFGVSRFNYGYENTRNGYRDGGSILANCGSGTSTLVSAIDGLNADNWTPLAESLYEVTRYFRGLSSAYNTGVSYTSPIQYRCQKNFTIVITDGLPTYDATFPTNDPDDPDGKLPNWDGIDNDGSNPTVESATEGHALFLDDIAKFAWDIDMRKGGTDAAGESFDDPRYPQQNMYTYTVGFTTDNDMLRDAAAYGNGLYLTADNAEQLSEALGGALADIQGKLGSASSAAASGGFISDGTKVYQGRMNSEYWTGQLLAFGINTTPGPTFGQLLKNGPGPDGSLWDAGSLINGANWGTRTIITNKAGGIPFRWDGFTATERNDYFNGQQNLLEYLRGSSVAAYRSRPSLLGDIVNSAPQYVAAPSARYPDSLETAPYSAFKQARANRTPMIYVGANDGMLHGFNAQTGAEGLAYIPGHLLGRLKLLADPDYNDNHKFYVDGTPTVVDAFIGGAWKTVLAGGLNKGGQAIYALDVTNPAQFSEANASSIFLWEFTDADDADLGYTYSRPAIVKLRNGTWAAVFGNGYNNTIADGHASTTGNAVLYIVDLRTGALIKKISTGVGTAQDPTGQNRPNGLATVTPIDLNGDNLVDYVYAGDLFGNMWKFDLNDSSASNWTLAYKLFQACAANTCTADNRQPITTAPTVIRHPNLGGQIVLFGTGKYLEQADNISQNGGVQSFYAIWDRNTSTSMPVGRNLLRQQRILFESTYTFTDPDGEEIEEGLRVTTDHAVNWASQRGWYIDLVSPHGFEGERQVTESLVRNGRLVFTTMIPSNSSDPCAPAGTSWIMEMNAVTGARLTYSPFDLDRDGQFSATDYVTVTIDGETFRVPATGRKTEGGHAQTPTVVSADGRELKYVSSTEGLEVIVENPGHLLTGRQSWRELFLQ